MSKPAVQDVMKIFGRSSKMLFASESGIANAIESVPDADPLMAAEDLVAWAEGKDGEEFRANGLLLKFMRQQAKDNPKSQIGESVRSCLGCRRRFHRNLLTQGRCLACYDPWAEAVLERHDRVIAQQLREAA